MVEPGWVGNVAAAAAGELDPTPLLDPRSIAVVGANDRPGSYGDIVLRNLDRAGFEGSVWGVNPRRVEVHGRECVQSVADLPQPVDAVVVAIPAAGVPAVIRDAAARDCGGAIVISAGFGEVPQGRELERELADAAMSGGLPLCGPNGNGIFAVGSRAPMWGDSVPPLEPGGVAMISQSGNVAVNALGSRRGIRYHTVLSTGNQAVLDASDWLAAVCRREGVRAIAMFLEEDGDGERLARSLAECAEREVRVAVLKVGASEAGARAASAHTGALAGDQRVFRALVEEAGGAWARDPHELLELARVLAEPRARPRGGGGLAVLTCSGGLGHRRRRGGAGRRRAARAFGRDPRATDGAAARRGHDRQSARLHRDDLGRHRPSAADHGHRRRRPRDRPAPRALRPPAGPGPGGGRHLGRGPRRDRGGRRRDEGRHPGRLHPPRPDRRPSQRRARRTRRAGDRGTSDRAGLRPGPARPAGEPGAPTRDRHRRDGC